MRNTLLTASIVALSVAIVPACATKGFVREEVGAVNTKVDTLGGTVEQTQSRVGQTEQRIGAVDQKAEAAGKAASDARAAATDARSAADKAQASATAVGGRVDVVGGRVDAVAAQVAAEAAASRRLVYEVTLSEAQGNFKVGAADLPDAAKARLDEVIAKLKGASQNVFLEIEGHTDNVGSVELNERLGLERAEAVKRYLYEQHQIPLHKMNVISFGEEKPVAPNTTRGGRAQNRRVVVKVLS